MSNHPIAKSICESCKTDNSDVTSFEEISGFGIKATIKDAIVFVGNEKLMQRENIEFAECTEFGTKVYVAYNGKYL